MKKLSKDHSGSMVVIMVILITVLAVAAVGWQLNKRMKKPEQAATAKTNAPIINNETSGGTLKIGAKLSLAYPGNWSEEAAGNDFDYALVGDTNYKILIETIQGGEGSPDPCGDCKMTQLNESFMLGNEKLYLIAATSPAIQNNIADPPNGIAAYKIPERTRILLSRCPSTFCMPAIPGSADKMHFGLYYFEEGALPGSIDISTQRTKNAVEVMKKLSIVP